MLSSLVQNPGLAGQGTKRKEESKQYGTGTKRRHRSMEQTREPQNKALFIWSTNLQQKR